jgi:hypothetical protein
MDFYTLEGASNLAKKRGKATCFWNPVGVSGMGNHKWCYDSSGTLKEYKKPSKYSTKIAFDGKGKRVI